MPLIQSQDDEFERITQKTQELLSQASAANAINPNQSYTLDKTADYLYDQEDIIHKARMLAADIRVNLDDRIDRATLSMSAKESFHIVTAMLFDQNVVLALNENVELRKLQAREALNWLKLACKKPDIMNPIFVVLKETIYQAFCDFVSRSYRGTERFEQGKRTTVSDQRITHTVQGQPEKRGFSVPFLGKVG